MKTKVFQREMLDRIRSYRNMQIQEELWGMLDSYDKYLQIDGTPDELAEAAFYRGEAYFRAGKYTDTVEELTKSLQILKTNPYLHLEAQAYNILGMLFSFVGYETVALENYLLAVSSAEQNENQYEAIASLLNIGLLYQNLTEYSKALHYYNIAFEKANRTQLNPDIEMSMLVMVQKAQLFCKMERFEDAMSLFKQANAYQSAIKGQEVPVLPLRILDVYMEEHFGELEIAEKKAEKIISGVGNDSNFMEQIDFYMEFCEFLLVHKMQENAKKLMDELKQKLALTEFIHLRIKLEEMEISYQKNYSDRGQYLQACQHYMELQEEYEKTMQEFRRKNLENIELLQKTEEKRKEFEEKSQRDLATGLLNKVTLEAEIREYLNNKKKNTTDLLLMIDIDNFKLANDTYGHMHGDSVIEKLAELIKKCFMDRGICGRFGGDEFVVFLPEVESLEKEEVRIEAFRDAFSKISFGKTGNVHRTISIGVSYNQEIKSSYEAMVSCADEALMKTKEYGKNKVTFFEMKKGTLRYE
ncbi:MAG: GGDEF domain-containing protein [Roseburia sp.]